MVSLEESCHRTLLTFDAVSNIEVEGPIFESRIQGGILADGCNGLLASLMTITPMSTYDALNSGFERRSANTVL